MPSKDVKDLLKRCIDQGWVVRRGRKHIKVYSPDGKTMIVLPNTPAKNNRSIKNAKAVLKRAGLEQKEIMMEKYSQEELDEIARNILDSPFDFTLTGDEVDILVNSLDVVIGLILQGVLPMPEEKEALVISELKLKLVTALNDALTEEGVLEYFLPQSDPA